MVRAVPLRATVASLVLAFGLGCGADDPLGEIRELHASGRFEESLDPLRELVDARTGDAEVYYLYGVALASTREVTQAVWPLRKAMESPEWYEPAVLHLAQLSLMTTDWDMATSLLDELIERNPESTRGVLLRAYARAQSRQDYEGTLSDADAVLAEDPQNGDALVLRAVALLGLERIEEASEAIEATSTHYDEIGLGLAASPRFCVVRAIFAKEKKELERAEEIFEECVEEHPVDFLVVDEAAGFFDERGKSERSLEIIRAAFEGVPELPSYRLSLVNRLTAIGEYEEAEQLLLEATESPRPEVAASAFADLARFYFQRDDLDGAISAFEQALELVPEPGAEFLFTYADVLVAGGRYDAALALTERMTLVPHRELVRGRVALEQGDPALALHHFGEGQKLWPNNAVSRYFTALAAERLGDFDRAIEEYRYSARADASATDARMRLARLYSSAGQDEEALHAIRHEADAEAAVDPLGYVLFEIELMARVGRANQLPERLLAQVRPPAVWPEAIAAIARGARVNRGPEASLRVVEQADRLDANDPRNVAALRSVVGDLIALGRVDEAVARTEAALEARPDAGVFHALHSFALEQAGGDAAAIRAGWERAVEADGDDAFALRGLAAMERAEGRSEEALALLARAVEADSSDTEALRESAEIHAEAGRHADEERLLLALLERDPYDGSAALRLAQLMLEREGGGSDPAVLLQLRRAERFGQKDEATRLLARVDPGLRDP